MATQITRQQQRRDSSANWAAFNPVLLAGELGYDTTLNRIKVGDGVSQWSALSFADEAGGAEAAEAAAIAAAATATAAATAAEEARDEALQYGVPASQVIVPAVAEEYQVFVDDLTVVNLIQTGSTGPSILAKSERVMCTVTCVVDAPLGVLLGAALADGLATSPSSLTFVKTEEPTTVSVMVSLDLDPGEVVQVVPVASCPFGGAFVNVGRSTPEVSLADYGPLSILIQQV